MTTLSELLRAAADLVDKGWTQREYARDAEGNPCSSHAEEAVCWCALGAINRAQGEGMLPSSERLRVFYDAKRELEAEIETAGHPRYIPLFNDTIANSAADVSGMMRRAANRLDRKA